MTALGDGNRWNQSFTPRSWQLEALSAWQHADHHGIVSVVTGAGKTVFAQMCISAYGDQHPCGRVVIIVPTLALLDQWYLSLQEDLGVPPEHIALYSGESRSEAPRDINLLVLNTARAIAPTLNEGQDSLLIVDEVHRVASPINSLALAGNWAASLGMSATPERQYDSGFEDIVVPALGETVYTYDYLRAVEDGVISRFALVNVEIDLLADERALYVDASRRVSGLLRRLKSGEDVNGALRRALQRRAAISAAAVLRAPVAVRLVEKHRNVRTVIFHERIEAAEDICRTLQLRGLNATIYHSKISPALRRDNLQLFRRGAFDVLVTCRALDEGVNVPETAVAIIASSTASTRQRVQRLGRVLRPAPGKQLATVYTIYATDIEQRRLEREVESGIGADTVSWMRGRAPTDG